MTENQWPESLPVSQIRIARPTDRLDQVVSFYRNGIGLEVIGGFTGHAGYDGVMLGLPDNSYHLEFTQHQSGSPCPAPTADNLLVFYIPDRKAITLIERRLGGMGCEPVEAENPYWTDNGALTFEDPDGWRIVLMPSSGIGSHPPETA